MYPDTIVVALKTLGFTTTATTADGVTAPKSLKELFGVRAPKSLKELNKRYHLLALKHHPDKVCDGRNESVGAEDGDALFKEINESHKRVRTIFILTMRMHLTRLRISTQTLAAIAAVMTIFSSYL